MSETADGEPFEAPERTDGQETADEPEPTGATGGSVVGATLLASVLAGVLSGGFVYTFGRLYMRYLGAAVSNGAPVYGLGAWVGMAVVLGVVFAAVTRSYARAGKSTTGYGLVYGVVLAVFVGLLAIPAAVTASTEWSFPYTQVSVSMLVGFAIYGLVMGSVFGKRVGGRPLRPLFLVGRTRSVLLASLVAGAVAGGMLVATAPHHLAYFALLVGGGASVPVGFTVFLAFAVLLGTGFAVFPARRVERQDLPSQSGFKLGSIYGIILAVLGGVLVIPQLLGAGTAFDAPRPRAGMLAGYLVFGVALGVGYGVIEGEGGIGPEFLRGRGLPVLGGSIAGSAAGALFIYPLAKSQPFYFLGLSYLGVRPSWRLGVGVWFALCLLMGVLFVPVAARGVESKVGAGRGLAAGGVYGLGLSLLLGVFLMPTVIQARGFPIDSPSTQPTVFAYAVFGLAYGGVYGALRRRRMAREQMPTSPSVGTRGQRAIVFGSLFGGASGGLLAYHMVGPVTMLFMGSLVGRAGSLGVGWVVWLGLSLVLGMVFAVAVGPRLSDYTRTIDEFAEREEDVNETIGDYLENAPVTTTATMAGFVYGVVVAVAVGAIAIPIAVNTMSTHGMPVPVLQPYFLLAFVVYGLIMGLGYGLVKEF